VSSPILSGAKLEGPKVSCYSAMCGKCGMGNGCKPKIKAPSLTPPKLKTPKMNAPKLSAPKVDKPKVGCCAGMSCCGPKKPVYQPTSNGFVVIPLDNTNSTPKEQLASNNKNL
jgi:hypothetical protein